MKLLVRGITAAAAGDHFGWFSAVVSIDNPTSSALTQERLGWKPGGPALLADIKQGHYFHG